MNRQEIRTMLQGYNPLHIDQLITYIVRMDNEKKDGVLVNPWMAHKTNQYIVDAFKKAADQGLVFDGVHITISNVGISYDYIAYKNKMLLTYPETVMDIQVVYKGDTFQFSKESGKVIYSHVFGNPFDLKEQDIIGVYAIIKNRRGESLTVLSRADIEKHMKVAKTKKIWEAWFKEMCLKTAVKKAVKVYFEDVFTEMLAEDNEENDLSLLSPSNTETLTEMKAKIDSCNTRTELKAYWETIPVKTKAINQLVAARRDQLPEEAQTPAQ